MNTDDPVGARLALLEASLLERPARRLERRKEAMRVDGELLGETVARQRRALREIAPGEGGDVEPFQRGSLRRAHVRLGSVRLPGDPRASIAVVLEVVRLVVEEL